MSDALQNAPGFKFDPSDATSSQVEKRTEGQIKDMSTGAQMIVNAAR